MVIRKAVFPVAGLGTRFLPATKASPKEMMPIVDKPLIQYAVEESIAAGITELIFVTSSSKRAIEDHFDRSYELESRLVAKQAEDLLKVVQDILPSNVSCAYVRQSEPLGLGHAVLSARRLIGKEPFAVLLADDLIKSNLSCLRQMSAKFSEVRSSIVAVNYVDIESITQYGVIATENVLKKFGKISEIVEKPNKSSVPSNFGVVGRYILTPEIFDYLEKLKFSVGGEIQLTDAISCLIKDQSSVFAYEIDGVRYDCGQKLGYLQAIVAYGVEHNTLGNDFKNFLKDFISEDVIC